MDQVNPNMLGSAVAANVTHAARNIAWTTLRADSQASSSLPQYRAASHSDVNPRTFPLGALSQSVANTLQILSVEIQFDTLAYRCGCKHESAEAKNARAQKGQGKPLDALAKGTLRPCWRITLSLLVTADRQHGARLVGTPATRWAMLPMT